MPARPRLVPLVLGLALLAGFAPGYEGAPEPRREFFVLEEPLAEGGVRVVGVQSLTRRAKPGSTLLESTATFAREDRASGVVRVFAVEELTPERASLSWRELAAGSGRSLRAEWFAGGDGLDVTEWGNGPRWREELASDEGALLPHYLIELLRRGGLTAGSVPCFEPLARGIERYEISTWYEAGPGGERPRTVELVRTDGTLAARYRFTGARLDGFQWQAGGPMARAVDEAEYEAAERELATPRPAGS
ncbi:MAG: hypothetical protein IPJ77_21105 [Planctomycetes bacterium]|nr:hypothetical protein [Planctomycetota bacterium]